MNTHLVSYDLRQPGRNYPSLHQHLMGYKVLAKPLESVWLIKTDRTAEEVRDAAKLLVDTNDRLLVIDVTGDAKAWYNLTPENAKWIHNYA